MLFYSSMGLVIFSWAILGMEAFWKAKDLPQTTGVQKLYIKTPSGWTEFVKLVFPFACVNDERESAMSLFLGAVDCSGDTRIRSIGQQRST